MTVLQDFWQRLDRRARIGFGAGVVAIAAATAVAGGALLRTDYQVLFADLAPQDAATMTAELDKMKTPYRLAGDGNTILVPAEQVHKTRLKLVGKELPLRGAVGLELFNSSEVGMTEFTQKVNYQRALQGELTRTIQALDEVQSVRVHLVMAEQALFRKQARQAKASVSLALKPGRTLEAAQVQGIQRLVSAAVPDIRPADVTITDQRGLALTRAAAPAGDDVVSGGDGLDDKRAMETYLNKKVMEVLERAFGPGQGIASVDVTLKRDHTKTTTESVLGGANGAVVRERLTTRDNGGQAEPVAASGAQGTVSREADYQVGRKVEQVVSGAGGIARINVAVMLRGGRGQDQLDRIRDLVALAAGADKARGDAVSVYSMDQVAGLPLDPATLTGTHGEPAAGAPAAGMTATAVQAAAPQLPAFGSA
ncbi:flagellar basal-body MS-ring/collar protein FliF, partial [Pseudoduganella ginsengisoli]|nr:flagellar M-ring protein FliF [Pseudoduganella ginsengisoli]